MPRHFLFPFLAISFLLCSGQTTPPSTRPLKIGVVDTEKVFTSSALGKKAVADLKLLQEKAEATINPQIEAIKELQKKIDAGRTTLPLQLAQLDDEYERKVTAVRRAQEQATSELTKKRDDALAAIDQKVMPVINQIAQEQGYTLIFRKFESGLLFADEAVDVTAEVIKRLDAANPAK